MAFKAVAALAIALTLAVPAFAQTDVDILNFALQLECLEGEFYNYAAGNGGLTAAARGGGPVPTGGMAANLTTDGLNLAKEIALNELQHVLDLRMALGAAATPCPQVDLGAAFATAADAAAALANTSFSPKYSPYANDLSFWLASYLFEDVGVSAYQGAAPLITSKAYLGSAAGILAVEAYHASLARFIIYEYGYTPIAVNPTTTVSLYTVSGLIAQLRKALGGGDGQNVILPTGEAGIVPVDPATSITIPRTPAQVVAIVTAGAPSKAGLFFPNGLNGNIKG